MLVCMGMLLHFCRDSGDKGTTSFAVNYHYFIGIKVRVQCVYLACAVHF